MPCVAVFVCPSVTIQASERCRIVALAANFDRQHGVSLSLSASSRRRVCGHIPRAPAASLITASCSALGATRYALEPT